jgi:hypothetical protein
MQEAMFPQNHFDQIGRCQVKAIEDEELDIDNKNSLSLIFLTRIIKSPLAASVFV